MYMPKSAIPIQPNNTGGGYMPKSAIPVNTSQPIGTSVVNFAKGIAQPFINTGKNIAGAGYEIYRAGKQALGDKSAYVDQETGEVVQNPFLSEQELEKVSQPLSLEKGSALRQQISDSANIASYAVPFGRGTNIVTKAVIPGAVTGALTSMTPDADLEDIGTGAVGGALFSAGTYGAGKLFSKLPERLKKSSEDVVTRGLGNPSQQAKLSQKSGQSVGSFMKKYNLLDRSPQSASEVKSQIINQYDDLALNSGKKVSVGKIIKAIDDKVKSLQSGPSRFSESSQAEVAELLKRREQIIESLGGTATQSPIMADVRDVTLFRKKGLDPDIPKSMFNLDSKGSGTAQGAKATRDILKDVINSTDPRLEQLGLDYGMAKGIEKILSASQNRSGNRQLLNFSKLGSAGVGGILAGAPGVLAGFVAEQIVNHPQFIKVTSDVLSSGARGSEALRIILSDPIVQQLIYQLAARAGQSSLGQTEAQSSQEGLSVEKPQPYNSLFSSR